MEKRKDRKKVNREQKVIGNLKLGGEGMADQK